MPQPTGNAGFDVGNSIIQRYVEAVKARNDKIAQDKELANQTLSAQSEAQARADATKQAKANLEEEHNRNMQQYDYQQGQLDLQRKGHELAHSKALLDISKMISEGQLPAPGNAQPENLGTDAMGNTIPNALRDILNPRQNAPAQINGETVTNYLTPQQAAEARKPSLDQEVDFAGKKEGAVEKAKVAADEPVRINAKQIKEDDFQKAKDIANINGVSREAVARINAQSRISAAYISKSGKGPSADDIAARAQELRMGVGPPPSAASETDRKARTALFKSGTGIEVNPKTVVRADSMSPVEDLPAQIQDFSDRFLGSSGQALANRGKAAAGLISDNDYTAARDSIIVKATQFAKSIEGAQGRVLKVQLDQAIKYVSGAGATREGTATRIKNIQDIMDKTVENITGGMPAGQKVEFLAQHGMPTFAKRFAVRYNVNDPDVVQADSAAKRNALVGPKAPSHINDIPGAKEIQ